jgi:NDP-sugar pyrophosphorylase family protein
VVSFPIIEYWLDIGQLADYEQAQNDMKHKEIC